MSTPMTTVSDISEMFAYFSMTERQLLTMIREGGSMEEILAKLPKLNLSLIDGTIYPDSGRVETISGVIEPTTGSVSMRAMFPNTHNVLRSNSTGKVIFPNLLTDIILIPQSATTEIQDKKFVFVVQPDNTVKNTEIKVYSLSDRRRTGTERRTGHHPHHSCRKRSCLPESFGRPEERKHTNRIPINNKLTREQADKSTSPQGGKGTDSRPIALLTANLSIKKYK